MKKILTLITFTLASFGISNAQDCDLPGLYSGNTGANMTVMLTPGVMGSLPATDADAYMVALSSDGLIIGSASVGNTSQTTIAVWGDDASTTEVVDGALAAESISFQLVNGTSLYDVVMPTTVSYTTNGLVVQAAPATVTLVDCSTVVEEVCPLPSSDVVNTGSNMTIMLTPALVASLNTSSDDAYLVAFTSEGNVVGSEVVGNVSQTSLAVWGDDSSTPEIDGALAGESISFQLVDGTSLFDVVMPVSVSFTANGMSVQAAPSTVTIVDCSSASEDVLGCMDATANNFDAAANVDDASCTYDVLGCMDATANNFDAAANVDDASCTYDVLGCMDATANNFDAAANVDDASCTYDVLGCMDATAFNYNELANTDDGSCIAVVNGCMDVTAFNYNELANTEDESCVSVVEGCMDATASNYNELANTVGESCIYGTPIEYQLSAGWNMVGYTGTAVNNGIVAQMDAALGNGVGTANTFQVIKNVSGQFWSAAFAQISTFNQGQGYMMYVNGATTTVNFQQTSGYISGIEYALSAGWNMVAFTGDVDAENNIVSSMDAALGNAASTANTFQVIKNVSGQFWSAAFAQISTFNPGQAYMMYVNGSTTTVNFQQE